MEKISHQPVNIEFNHILIFDDELLGLEHTTDTIKQELPKFTNLSACKIITAQTYNECMELVVKFYPKIIFLDIEAPIKNGIQIADEIQEFYLENNIDINTVSIIFVTAHDSFAYPAFKVNAIDYILKPITDEDILSVLGKISARITNKTTRSIYGIVESEPYLLTVTHNGIQRHIKENEIVYFNADNKYINVFTTEKPYLILDTIINLSVTYPDFIRAHRSYLINPKYIMGIYKKGSCHVLQLKHGTTHIPIARRHLQDVRKKLSEYQKKIK